MNEAIVLAGGMGTRLRTLVGNVPKPMAPIGNRPFLEILLTSLSKKGFKRIILSLGYMAEKISSHFGGNFNGMEIIYVTESEPLGTGGGIRLAMDKVTSETVFVFNGDTFLDLEVSLIRKRWTNDQRPIIVGREVENTARYGRLVSSANLAICFNEKGIAGAGIINAGCYLLNSKQLDLYKAGEKFSFEEDYLPNAIKNGVFDVFQTQGIFIDIGLPDDFLRAQTALQEY